VTNKRGGKKKLKMCHTIQHQEFRKLKKTAKDKADKKSTSRMNLGKLLCKLTPTAYDTRCYRNKFHTRLNRQDQAVFERHKPEITKHLSRTTKFLPTGKKLSSKEMDLSCAKFALRLVSRFKNHHKEQIFEKLNERDRQAGIKKWIPKKIKMTTAEYENSVKSYFRSDEWRRTDTHTCIQLPHLITDKVASLKSALYSTTKIKKLKTNFSSVDRRTCTLINKSRMLINTTDKICQTIIISEYIFKEQVLLHLQDGLGTFTIVDSSNETLLDQIKQEFEDAVARFECPKNNQHALDQ
jgi:hypothetical protein